MEKPSRYNVRIRGDMMPATLPRFWWSLLLGILALALTGCGAVAKRDDAKLTQGNWSVTSKSSNPAIGTFHVGGNFTQNGSTLSGTMYVVGSHCFDVSHPIS